MAYKSAVYTPESYVDAVTLRKCGPIVELYLGHMTENVTASTTTISIGVLPTDYWPRVSENGVIIAALSGIPVYIGIGSSGTLSVRFCASIASGTSLYGRFVYIGVD